MKKPTSDASLVSTLRKIAKQEEARKNAEAFRKKQALERDRRQKASTNARIARAGRVAEKQTQADQARIRRGLYAEEGKVRVGGDHKTPPDKGGSTSEGNTRVVSEKFTRGWRNRTPGMYEAMYAHPKRVSERERDKAQAHCSEILRYVFEAALRCETQVLIPNRKLEKHRIPRSRSRLWVDFGYAGFNLIFQRRSGVVISWEKRFGGYDTASSYVQYLWIDTYYVWQLMDASKMLTKAMKEASIDGTRYITVDCEQGRIRDITDAWKLHISGTGLGTLLPTTGLSPSHLVRIFRLLKCTVAIQWKDHVNSDDEIDAHGSGGKLRISWGARSIKTSTQDVREPWPTRNLAQEEQLRRLSKATTCPRCSKTFKPQDVTERLKYAIRCPHCRQVIVNEDLENGLIGQLSSPGKIQFP